MDQKHVLCYNGLQKVRGGKNMPDYKAMYFELASKIADAISLLLEAQRAGEEEYIKTEEES